MSTKLDRRTVLKTARSKRFGDSETTQIVRAFLSDIDSPRSLTVWMLFVANQHDDLINLQVDPLDYNTSTAFADAYIPTEFLSKASFLNLSTDRKAVAMEKFFAAEEVCSVVNRRLVDAELRSRNTSSEVDRLIFSARRKIERLLGDFSGEELFELSGWGPGVTTLLKGKHVSAYNKFRDENGITRPMYPLCRELFPAAYPRWTEYLLARNGEQLFKLEIGNTVVTVPKNAKSDRVIAIEPGINLWFQKGIGSMIRRRLRRVGIDLSNQQPINQLASKEASLRGRLATVDFSSASDTIALETVRLLLPPEWVTMMDDARSQYGCMPDGSVRLWNKFSSMGNGFTFELESLIFWALAQSSCELVGEAQSDVCVYGDDVILPVRAFGVFRNVCDYLGFTMNSRKTYSVSYFRESCGSHWFNGVCVKPIYLKDKPSNVHALYRLANSIRRHSHKGIYGCDRRFRASWYFIVSLIPPSLRLGISEGYGDVGLIVNLDQARPSRLRHSLEGWSCWALQERPRTSEADGTPLLLRGLKYGTDRNRGNTYDMRGSTTLALNRLVVRQWYDLGPWI